MTDIDKQYWKIKEFADHFGLDRSTVYNQIERGEIRAIRIGKTALRIPTDEVKRILDSFVEPHEQPQDLDGRIQDFEARTGRTPADFAAAWREDKIEDTPQNATDAIEALALREAMQHTVQHRMELEMDLREALEKDEFFLAYQPTINLSDMSPTGVEALIRWKHPVRGVVQPNDFIPLLEETGLIVEVGRWVLREACSQGAAWRAAGYPIGMAVNVSGRQLDTDQLVIDIEEALGDSGLDPEALTIEITETTLMRNVEETTRRLTAIKALGVRIAIDDFGTGYSSLAHLQQFPVDALKIDRSFISQLQNNQEGETLIHTLVQLGKALSIETFAEGIEQQQELSLLQDEDCDNGQGFLFARPLDVAATEAFLRSWADENATPAPVQAPQHA
jgi:excisionase family DNA binding protein